MTTPTDWEKVLYAFSCNAYPKKHMIMEVLFHTSLTFYLKNCFTCTFKIWVHMPMKT